MPHPVDQYKYYEKDNVNHGPRKQFKTPFQVHSMSKYSLLYWSVHYVGLSNNYYQNFGTGDHCKYN